MATRLKKDKTLNKSSKASLRWISSIPLRPRKPVILVNIADDHMGRGDTAGRIGIGKALARLLGGHYLFASAPSLAETFSNITTPANSLTSTYPPRVAALLAPYGKADFIIGSAVANNLTHPGSLTETDYNESLSSELLPDDILVSHDLTPENLAVAGADFMRHHPGLKGPLIAVLVAGPARDADLYQRLSSIAATYGQATIFLCGCHRTNADVLDDAQNHIRAHITKAGKAQDIAVLSYKYSRDDAYNPYRGLIARADHFVIWGQSQSLCSEALVRGRMIYICDAAPYMPAAMISRGYARDLSRQPRNLPFQVSTFDPPNVTDDVARALIKKKKKNALRKKNSYLMNDKTIAYENITADQHHYLKKIAEDPRAITTIPRRYQSSLFFIRCALAANPHTLQYMGPAIRRDPRSVLLAASRDITCLDQASPALMHDKDFVIKLMKLTKTKEIVNIYESLPLALREDIDVAIQAAAKSILIEKFMSPEFVETLYNNKKYVLAVAHHSNEVYTLASDTLKEDPDFIDQLLALNPLIYKELSPAQQSCPHKAEKYFAAARGPVLRFLAPETQDNETIARIAIRDNYRNGEFISDRLKNSPAFYRSLDKDTIDAIIYAHGTVLSDRRAMMHATRLRPDLYSNATDNLRQNSLFTLYTLKKAAQAVPDLRDIASYIPNRLLADPSFLIRAAQFCPSLLRQVPRDIVIEHYADSTAGIALARGLGTARFPTVALPGWFRSNPAMMQSYAAHNPTAITDPLMHRSSPLSGMCPRAG